MSRMIVVALICFMLTGCTITGSVFVQKDWPHDDLHTKAELKASREFGR